MGALQNIAAEVYRQKPALRNVLTKLTNISADAYRGVAQPPTIDPSSLHFEYAVLTLNGVPKPEACKALGVKPETVERWRSDLRRVGSEFLGRDVTYEFLIGLIIPIEWHMVHQELNQELRSKMAEVPKRVPAASASERGTKKRNHRSHHSHH